MEGNTSNINPQEGSAGPAIALIIILAVIVLGGLYFWGQRSDNNITDIYGNPISTSTPAVDTSAIETQSSSDTSASIEADLKSTKLDNLDSQLNVQ